MSYVLGDVLDSSFGDDGCLSLFVERNIGEGHANIVLDLRMDQGIPSNVSGRSEPSND